MTVGFVMIKGSATSREPILDYLNALIENDDFTKKSGAVIEDVVCTFGWPDFMVTLFSTNVELLKHSIVVIRDLLKDLVPNALVETSTIIGVSSSEIKAISERITEKQLTIMDEYDRRRKNKKVTNKVNSKINGKIREWLLKK